MIITNDVFTGGGLTAEEAAILPIYKEITDRKDKTALREDELLQLVFLVSF